MQKLDPTENSAVTDEQPIGRASRQPASRPAPAPRKRISWLRPLLGAAVILATLLAGGLLYARNLLTPVDVSSNETAEFEVLPGWGANQVASALEDAGLVKNARAFSLYLRYQNLDREVGEGLYGLSPSMDAAQLASALVAGGRPRTVTVLLPEGLRRRDVMTALAEANIGTEAELELLSGADSPLKPPYIPQAAGLEGYLFPAGYDLPVDSSPELAVSLMVERFERELTPEVEAQLAELGLSVHDWVTLASIIQSEAAGPEEMPIIAGVFLNRLDRDMLLQSDPTVAYGLGKALPELDAVAGDMQADHPWNTYVYPGLPPGPISNPGRDALQSVFSPQRQTEAGEDYLYFLHGSLDGAIIFRPNTTLDAHNADVETYLR